MKELEGSDEDFQVIKSEVTEAFEKFSEGNEIRVPATLNFVCCDLS
jgi:hypothetical protein